MNIRTGGFVGLLLVSCSLQTTVDGEFRGPNASDAGPDPQDARVRPPRQDAVGRLDSGSVDSGGSDTPGPRDSGGGERDAGAADAGSTDTRTSDAGSFDAGSFDAGSADTARADVGTPDAGRPTCDSLLASSVPSYARCEAEPNQCEFYSVTNREASCRQMCVAAGLSCVDSFAEASDAAFCTRTKSFGCDHEHGDSICVCRR